MRGSTGPSHRRALAWSWSRLLLGAVYALPGALVSATGDPARGLALAVGVLPAAAAGLPARRRDRARVVGVGLVAALAVLLGGVAVAVSALVGVLALVAACLLASAAVTRRAGPVPRLVLTLGVPMIGIGLSATSPAAAGATALLVVAGSVYAWLVSSLWPERPPAWPGPARTVPAPGPAYGVQLALAGGVSAALGLLGSSDHPGWAATCALLVSRPRGAELRSRALERSVGVVAAAVLACAVAATLPAAGAAAGAATVALAGAAATAGSRWYATPFFSTLVVLSLLLGQHTEPALHWLLERVAATVVGVLVALAAGWAVLQVPRARHGAHGGHASGTGAVRPG